jgi:hypothetical protein
MGALGSTRVLSRQVQTAGSPTKGADHGNRCFDIHYSRALRVLRRGQERIRAPGVHPPRFIAKHDEFSCWRHFHTDRLNHDRCDLEHSSRRLSRFSEGSECGIIVSSISSLFVYLIVGRLILVVKTPKQTFIQSIKLAHDRQLDRLRPM